MEWNSHVHGEFPGNVESTNLSRETLSRETGRTCFSWGPCTYAAARARRCPAHLPHWAVIPVSVKKEYPPENNNLGKLSLRSAKSWAGERLLPLDCRAEVHPKGAFFHRHPYSYPYPCPEKFYKLPTAVLICSTNLLFKLSWAWVWVQKSQHHSWFHTWDNTMYMTLDS